MKCSFIIVLLFPTTVSFAQNIGIGLSSPLYKLDVNGTIRTNANMYVDGFVGINTTSPVYRCQINNGSFAIYNTTDNVYWVNTYNSATNNFTIDEDAISRFVIARGGNVGIGNTQPATRLHVTGDVRVTNGLVELDADGVQKGFLQLSGDNVRVGTFSSNNTGSFVVRTNGTDRMEVDASGNTDFSGNLTVNAGKGILRNAEGSAQLKYYTEAFTFSTGSLPGNSLSGEGSIIFSVPFSSTPVVYVGNIVSTGGSVGELYRVQLILYGCNTTSCKARLLNTSPNTVNYSITWNVVCIGQ